MLDMLDRRGIRATVFVVGWVAERHPDLIHAVRDRADVRESLRVLAAIGVGAVTQFRAPEWSVNDRSLWALEVLAGEGIAVDASMAALRIVGNVAYPRYPHIRHTDSGPITEVPPLVADRYRLVMPMGWGWGLRMSSPRRVLRAIDAENRAGRPAVLTVHPWELDPDPPRVQLPARLRFAHYFRLGGFERRLSEVLAGAAFGSIGDFLSAGPTIPVQ
jgi:peptidoglycan/xylan/chitin deacetylase (PgdA/CDA1 family)